MKSSKTSHRLMLIATIFALATTSSYCQAYAQDSLVTKAYPVKDILIRVNSYGFQSVDLPGTGDGSGFLPRPNMQPTRAGGGGGGIFSVPDDLNRNIAWRQSFGGGGLGGGGMGGGGMSISGGSHSGGFVMEDDETVDISHIEDTLVSLLEMRDPQVWDRGIIQRFGNSTLILTTSAENHDVTKRHLEMLRQVASETGRSVTVMASWLRINHDQFQSMERRVENGVVVIDRSSLVKMKDNLSNGTITCFDGQTVHLISGEMRNRIQTVSPVVGSIEPRTENAPKVAHNDSSSWHNVSSRKMATQEESGSQPGNIGYKPITDMINEGALLEVTPIILPDSKEAIINVASNIVLPMNSQEQIDFNGVIKLDRQHIQSQQFRTSLRLPLEQPVLVGGSTVQVDTDSALYLVLEVHAGK